MEAGDQKPEPAKPATPRPDAGARPTTGSQAAAAQPLEERVEGLRSWVATLDRKLGVRSYAGAAAVVLGLAAGIVGVVLALSAKDESATKDEVRALRDQVEIVQEQASEATEEDLATLTDRLDALEGRVNTIAAGQRTTESELSVVQDDIDELRGEISSGGGSGGSGALVRHRALVAIATMPACGRPTTGLRSRERLLKGAGQCLRVTASRNARRSRSRIPSRSR